MASDAGFTAKALVRKIYGLGNIWALGCGFRIWCLFFNIKLGVHRQPNNNQKSGMVQLKTTLGNPPHSSRIHVFGCLRPSTAQPQGKKELCAGSSYV